MSETDPHYVKLHELITTALGTAYENGDDWETQAKHALDAIWPEINRLYGVQALVGLRSEQLREAMRLLVPCVDHVDTTNFVDKDWNERAVKLLVHRERPGDV